MPPAPDNMKKHVPLSQRWVQFGVTFSPVPQVLWGRTKEIEAEVRRRGHNSYSPPKQIDSAVADIGDYPGLDRSSKLPLWGNTPFRRDRRHSSGDRKKAPVSGLVLKVAVCFWIVFGYFGETAQGSMIEASETRSSQNHVVIPIINNPEHSQFLGFQLNCINSGLCENLTHNIQIGLGAGLYNEVEWSWSCVEWVTLSVNVDPKFYDCRFRLPDIGNFHFYSTSAVRQHRFNECGAPDPQAWSVSGNELRASETELKNRNDRQAYSGCSENCGNNRKPKGIASYSGVTVFFFSFLGGVLILIASYILSSFLIPRWLGMR
jgi:hypothetical protein